MYDKINQAKHVDAKAVAAKIRSILEPNGN